MIRQILVTNIGAQNLKNTLKGDSTWSVKAIGFGSDGTYSDGSETDLKDSNATYFDAVVTEPSEDTICYNITVWGGQVPSPVSEIGLTKNATETDGYLLLRAVCDPIYISNASSWIFISLSLTFR